MAEYKQMSIYFDLEKPDEAWAYQYLMSQRHGKKAMIITALKMMLGKGGQAVPFSVQAMPPRGSVKKKKADRQAFGRQAADTASRENHADAAVVESAGENKDSRDRLPAEGESGESPDSGSIENVPPDAVPISDGRDIQAQGDAEPVSDWRAFFTQEQTAAILEKGLDMSRLTEDGILQMAGQVQDGIPARAAYKEALMWCQ